MLHLDDGNVVGGGAGTSTVPDPLPVVAPLFVPAVTVFFLTMPVSPVVSPVFAGPAESSGPQPVWNIPW